MAEFKKQISTISIDNSLYEKVINCTKFNTGYKKILISYSSAKN